MSLSVDDSASRRDDLEPSVSRIVVFVESVYPVRSRSPSVLLVEFLFLFFGYSVEYVEYGTMLKWRGLNRSRIRAEIGSVVI